MFRKHALVPFCILYLGGCTTLDKSFQLGGTVGAATGAAAILAGRSGNDDGTYIQEVGIGAGIGFGLGLILSYVIHQSVVADRADSASQTELYFGGLPPSPFVIPQKSLKRGVAR